ncbi:MAG: T9SS type A sorting domain-containing protein [Lewinellaceae bacterium]|nr:T9SS type A sorting domain-containing protein [Phaeodactylibacter sp.]MCB9036207.1 T9SS type A sorting domain-containing protein [Lewinellaceae bacterium]
MYRNVLLFLCFILSAFALRAQVVYSEPASPTADEEVTIFFDASQGDRGLENCNCDVYLHTGVITSQSSGSSDWRYVPTVWGQANPDWRLTPVSGQNNLYSFTFTPSIRAFFGVPGTERIQQLAFVFRNATGSQSGRATGGSDLFLDVFDGGALLQSPNSTLVIVEAGETIPVMVTAIQNATFSVYDNGALLTVQTGSTLEYNLVAADMGTHLVEIVVDDGSGPQTLSFTYIVARNIAPADPPAGLDRGITFENGKLQLLFYAPNKRNVFLLGDFNDYQVDPDFQLTPTDDGYWWIEVNNLPVGGPVTFQYLVDGNIRVADPYSTLILDPGNDPFIPEVTYPNLPDYPEGAQGVVTLIDPAVAEYNWQVNNFSRPPREELVVYELLLRDFLERHDYSTLIDTLNYLRDLGVNAIELMPVNEFAGNESWGYNPTFHMALDKYYGPIKEFKRFVDACHARGIAVILDVVYNHIDLPSPLGALYWDSANNRPAADNPWLNQQAPHAFSVFLDINHESAATRVYLDKVIRYWLSEFRVDGYRFDLSKGLTQNQNGPFDAGAYDASRIAIIKHYADVMWATSPGCYTILEHFAEWSEERELTSYGQGMMVWNNQNHPSRDAVRVGSGGLNGLSYTSRGWDTPYALVSYMESHDEERLMYEALTFGSSSGSYNVRDFETALSRVEALSTIFYAVPGPKMLWQFGELGYDYSINWCTDGTINDNCRVGNKPIRWDYLEVEARRHLFNVTRQVIAMRKAYDAFHSANFEADLGSAFKKVKLFGSDITAVAVANMGLTAGNAPSVFPSAGTWYEFFSRESINVNTPNILLPLQAGEYRLYTSEPVDYTVDTRGQQQRGELELGMAPNPTDGLLTLSYVLPRASGVTVEVFNLNGQRVYSRNAGQQGQGWHGLELNTTLPAGTYTLKLTAGQRSEAKVFVVR